MAGFWKKWKWQAVCIAAGLALYAAALLNGGENSDVSDGYLERGGYGEDTKTYEFLAERPFGEPVVCQVEISPRRYTQSQALKVFEEIFDGLPEQILGENQSLLRIETDLILPTSFEGTGVSASWSSDAPDILDSSGQILTQDCPAEGIRVWLSVELTDGTYRESRSFPVVLFPGSVSEEEKLREAVCGQIRKADENDPASERVKLPESYEGSRLTYRQLQTGTAAIPFLGLAAAGLMYMRDKKKEEEKQKERRRQLSLDYADVVYQLMVFIGAGLTVGRAWERIVLNYEERRAKNRCARKPAYEEMADAQAQISCGVPEGQAIIEFGRRCRIPSYLKLSTLLEQNRRTGTKNLVQLLEQEMTSAWEQQKNLAKRMGEEAGTKLLLPLILMLLVVMVMIMVPALMTMG